MKTFNIAGVCIPGLHYMADTSDKINQIAEMVIQGNYFTINRARQYGKTTTLALLEELQGIDDLSVHIADFCSKCEKKLSLSLMK